MKIIEQCSPYDMLDHWRKVERFSTLFFRTDILEKLPFDMEWYEAEIESVDVDKIFIISSDDWRTITSTFQVVDVVKSLDSGIEDKKITNIKDKRRKFEEDIDSIDRKFILVGPTIEGNYTILEGNKRAVALQSIGRLIGNNVYLGISEWFRGYGWARYANQY